MGHVVSVKAWFATGSLLYRATCSCGTFEYFDKYELRAWNEAGAHFASEEYADAYDKALTQFRALNEPQSSGREPETKTMQDKFEATNDVDSNGNPTGGNVYGVGLQINWQDGPLGRDNERQLPNGAFVETVIAAAKQRIEFYQTASGGKFANVRNGNAINFLSGALYELNERKRAREARKVEGTHTV